MTCLICADKPHPDLFALMVSRCTCRQGVDACAVCTAYLRSIPRSACDTLDDWDATDAEPDGWPRDAGNEEPRGHGEVWL